MKNKHTPGPWHVGTDGNVFTGVIKGELVATISHNADGPDKPWEHSSKPANGALIAASPELFNLVKQYREALINGPENLSLAKAERLEQIADALIAKVE